mgnify:CR=1 FL=1
MKRTLDRILLYSIIFFVACGGGDIIEETIEQYKNNKPKVVMKFKVDDNVLERYTYNQVGELVYLEVDSLLKRDQFRNYLNGDWLLKYMIVDEDTLFSSQDSSNIDSLQNVYSFSKDSLKVLGWKYNAAYRVKFFDSLNVELRGNWEFDDLELYTYRKNEVKDRDTLTINSYSEFIWNNFLNTTDKEEIVVFIRK